MKKHQREKGFTLIELMVAVSIFAIVVMISMGAIFTVVDANKKAQTLKSVMNNLNFALETMTRTIKTGVINPSHIDPPPEDSITVQDQDGQIVKYGLGGDTGNQITRKIGSGGLEVPITAPEVRINTLRFVDGTRSGQPSVVMIVQGVASTSPTIGSNFSIQSTITQRLVGN